MEENQIQIEIGTRLPEIFTEEEVEKLVMIAEEWLEFCQKQKRTEEEKKEGRNPCDRCPLKGSMFDLDLCGKFQEFFRMRVKKLQQIIEERNDQMSASARERNFLVDFVGFLEGQREEPEF